MGRRFRALREASGLSRSELAIPVGLSPRTVESIERGERRTRRSTLATFVAAMVAAYPDLGDVDLLVEELVTLAGPALAPESAYMARVVRRRARRVRRIGREREAGRRLQEAAWAAMPGMDL